ncbi:MAG: pyridoxal phosphate-dependent aminotransferase [bacterium]|nr:pyridoxal phosphate-dependent aminotransferase [bacterium]
MRLSDRINQLEESGTVQFTLLLQQMRKEGKQVIDLAVGEPPFDTPENVLDATKQALDQGKTKYGPVAGLQELKSRLARQFQGYDEKNIIISNGSKQCLYMMFQAICDPLDEVIISRPYWVSFPQQVKLAGGRPVFADTRNHQLDIEMIEQAVTPKTRAILINSPNNPTGAVYPLHDLVKIAELALKHNLFVISDEAYSAYLYDGLRTESMFDFEEIRPQLIMTRSFSKCFNMTGFRIGYVAAPSEIIGALNKLQSHVTGNVCTFAQYGALAALEMKDSELVGWRDDLQGKRDFAFSKISRLFDCIRPQGAFYLFPDVSSHLGNGITSADLARRMLEETGVAVVPGEEFGMPGHIRISYAVSQDDLASGLKKITEAL